MRRFPPAVLVVLTPVLILAWLLPIAVSAQATADDALSVPQAHNVSRCFLEASTELSSQALLLGETSRITHHMVPICAGDLGPLHVALLFDVSATMEITGTYRRDVTRAARDLVVGLSLPDHKSSRVGVVTYSDTADVVVDLTNDEGRVMSAINRLRTTETENDEAIGLERSLRMLRMGRDTDSERDGIVEVIILFTDGLIHDCDSAVEAANRAAAEGVIVMAVCAGTACDDGCMRRIASSPRYYYQVMQSRRIVGELEGLRGDSWGIDKLEVQLYLPDYMRYVDGTALPMPSQFPYDGQDFRWEVDPVPAGGFTIALEVEPLLPGLWPAYRFTEAQFTDSLGNNGSMSFAVVDVMVLRSR